MTNFRNIIVPETLKCLEINDPTVLEILANFQETLSSCDSSLDNMIQTVQSVAFKDIVRKLNLHFIHYHTLSYTVPYHTMPYHTTPYSAIPYHTIPYHTIPYHTIQCHTIPYSAIPYSAIPCHTIPYHTIQCHSIAYKNICTTVELIKRFYRTTLYPVQTRYILFNHAISCSPRTQLKFQKYQQPQLNWRIRLCNF
jgi:hypothetical protein